MPAEINNYTCCYYYPVVGATTAHCPMAGNGLEKHTIETALRERHFPVPTPVIPACAHHHMCNSGIHTSECGYQSWAWLDFDNCCATWNFSATKYYGNMVAGCTRCCGCHLAILRFDGVGGNCSAVPVASGMSAHVLANVMVNVGMSLTVSGAVGGLRALDVGGSQRCHNVTTCWAPRRGCYHVVQLSKVCL